MAEHIKGLELSRLYYMEFGKKMLESFPEIKDKVAVGLVGSGSECFGYDDEISEDHDFEPGFCIFLPDESAVNRRQAFLLERAYAKLPKEFMGYRRSPVSPIGGNRHGVIRTADFLLSHTGFEKGPVTPDEWLAAPEYALAEAVNGEVFEDGCGAFSEARQRIMSYPADIKLKKLAGYMLSCVQSGQYNYPRCVKRGDRGAASLAAHEFVTAMMHIAFLRAGKYMPYYKWAFRALDGIDKKLSRLLQSIVAFSGERISEKNREETIEELCASAASAAAQEYGIKGDGSGNLKYLAYALNDRISDPGLRNLGIFAGV